MSIEYRIGDLFAQPDLDALAHGVNCIGVIGGGISGPFVRRWPADARRYASECETGTVPGDLMAFSSRGSSDPARIYLFTQQKPGPDARLAWIAMALGSAVKAAQTRELCFRPIRSIGLPRIGCGIGGLDWDAEVKPLLEDIAATTDVRLVVVTLPGESA